MPGTELRRGGFAEALGQADCSSALHMMTCLAGFQEGYPYPCPHTLYFLESANLRPRRFQPDQLRAKMILFAFGSALAQARLLYGVRIWRRRRAALLCVSLLPYPVQRRKEDMEVVCLTEEF